MPRAAGKREGGVYYEILASPSARNPVLVCGLPGSGYVGKLGVDHLVGVYGAKKVVQYHSDSFPPQVSVKEDGRVEPIKAELFYARTGQEKDMLIFTADAQPTTSEGEYELSDVVVRHAKKLGVRRVYTLAAYITGSFSKTPKVYGAATSREMIEEMSRNGVIPMKDGGITGMNGLIIGVASLHGLEGGCLLGETSGYVIDAAASKAVLEALSRILGIQIDTTSLKEKAEETQKVISQLQQMYEQSRETVAPPRRETQPGYIS
jgi:uncharacterized protein (TIGR00162 family)